MNIIMAAHGLAFGTSSEEPASSYPSGSLGHWSFNETSGDFQDATANNIDAARNNSAGNATGLIGSSLNVANNTQGATTGGVTTGTAWTISGWFKFDATQPIDYPVFFNRGHPANSTYTLAQYYYAAGNAIGLDYSSNGTSSTGDLETTWTRDTNWHFIAIRHDGTNISFKIDNCANITEAGTVRVGAAVNYIGNKESYPDGSLGRYDMWSIFDNYLSDAQITYLYNSGAGRVCQ